MNTQRNESGGKSKLGCNVNSTFNFTIGGLEIAAALLIGYLVYAYWWK